VGIRSAFVVGQAL